jgi:Ran GTPase-activating protein (RanGAP) involved in mRNA processing and transport
MQSKFDKLIDSQGLLDLFDYPLQRGDLALLYSHFDELSNAPIPNSIRFGHTAIDADGIEAISNALRSPHCAIKKLQFLSNQLGPEGALTLTEGLAGVHSSLTSLEMIDDDIAVVGTKALAEFLLTFPALTSLTLINTAIRSGSAVDWIAESLRVNTTLQVLE